MILAILIIVSLHLILAYGQDIVEAKRFKEIEKQVFQLEMKLADIEVLLKERG